MALIAILTTEDLEVLSIENEEGAVLYTLPSSRINELPYFNEADIQELLSWMEQPEPIDEDSYE